MKKIRHEQLFVKASAFFQNWGKTVSVALEAPISGTSVLEIWYGLIFKLYIKIWNGSFERRRISFLSINLSKQFRNNFVMMFDKKMGLIHNARSNHVVVQF